MSNVHGKCATYVALNNEYHASTCSFSLQHTANNSISRATQGKLRLNIVILSHKFMDLFSKNQLVDSLYEVNTIALKSFYVAQPYK